MGNVLPQSAEDLYAPITKKPPAGWKIFVFGILPFIFVFVLFWGAVLTSMGDDFQPGYKHYQQGNYAAAETDFRKYTDGAWTCNEPAGHYYLGLSLLHEGKFDEAREEIQNVYNNAGGGGKGGPSIYHYRATKLLKAMKELPVTPTVEQREQWLAKHPRLISPS